MNIAPSPADGRQGWLGHLRGEVAGTSLADHSVGDGYARAAAAQTRYEEDPWWQ